MVKNKLSFLCLVTAIFSFGFVFLFPGTSDANNSEQGRFPESSVTSRALMTRAVLSKLTVWTRQNGEPVYWVKCRELSYGCERQISTFVDYIFDATEEYNFNPWLLAGVAWHESRFYPFARSGAGAFGIFQILNRSRASRGLSFIHDRRVRNRCRSELGACQRPIVERAVFWLKGSIDRCGSIDGGLRMYNSGRCDGPSRYPRAVFSAKMELLEITKNDPQMSKWLY